MNYYKFTDGERTAFRATNRLYRSGIFDAHGNVSFSGDVANRPFSWPTVEIDDNEYKILVALKDGGTAPRDSWVWNKDLDKPAPEALQATVEAPVAAPAHDHHPNREAWLMALVAREGQTIRLSRGKVEVIDKPSAKRYFTLAVQETCGEPFFPQFGAYRRDVVIAEVTAYLEQGYTTRQVWILESGETQPEIDAALAKFNAGHRNVYK